MTELIVEPLTADIFSPFGEVIDLRTARQQSINYGLTTRYHDLARVDVNAEGGHPLVNVFRSSPLPLPHRVSVMERHPLGSQAFIPMRETRFLVLTAQGSDHPDPDTFRLFITDGKQGVNYFLNTWHHFQMVLGDTSADFLVIDRGGPGNNLDEVDVNNMGITINSVS